MMNEELYIKSRMGDKNPFRVPEGYFDNFAADLMQKLPRKGEAREKGSDSQAQTIDVCCCMPDGSHFYRGSLFLS